MAYCMRFFVDDGKKIDLDLIEAALKRVDRNYALSSINAENENAELTWKGVIYGEVELNRSGSDLMTDEVEELVDLIKEKRDASVKRVVRTLREAKCVLAVRVLWQDRSAESTLEKIDPLWEWLFRECRGLLQADGEGYYDSEGLVLGDE